jgi:salicylate hydroxylase
MAENYAFIIRYVSKDRIRVGSACSEYSVSGKVCMIGDAAHAMTTYQGLGRCQGIEDAFILGPLLAYPRTTSSANLHSVLQVYDSVRCLSTQKLVQRELANGHMCAF